MPLRKRLHGYRLNCLLYSVRVQRHQNCSSTRAVPLSNSLWKIWSQSICSANAWMSSCYPYPPIWWLLNLPVYSTAYSLNQQTCLLWCTDLVFRLYDQYILFDLWVQNVVHANLQNHAWGIDFCWSMWLNLKQKLSSSAHLFLQLWRKTMLIVWSKCYKKQT